MKLHRLLALGVAFAMLVGAVEAQRAAAVKSGPQVGEELAGPFHPLNCNGKAEGKKHCLYCENGNAPVAMIFAREPSANLTKLIKKLDEACVKNKSASMGSFVVFLSDDEGLGTKLKKIAKDENLKKVVLSIDNPAGPKGYKVSKDADVTVVLYVERTAKANYAFRKNGLTAGAVGTIVKDIPKILPRD